MPRSGYADFAARLRRIREDDLGQFAPVLASLLVIWAFFGVTEPAFLTPRNFHFLLMQSAVVATLAAGVTVVLLIGDIDLSIAAVAGVGAAILAVLITNVGAPAWIAVAAALAAGVVLGFAQGWVIACIGIPSFVVTLAGLPGFQGLMLKILGIHGALNMRDPMIRGLTTVGVPEWLGWLLAFAIILAAALSLVRINRQRSRRGLERMETGPLLARIALFAALVLAAVATLNAYRGVPLLMLILGAVLALLWWVTVATPFGRRLFAIGGNPESARRVGIPVKRMRIAAFTLVGLMAAFGGIIGASRYASVSFNAFAGGPLLLEAIGAAVIGGTSLFGGRGSVWNAVLGALVIGSLGNGLDLSGASAADKLMVSGAILLLAGGVRRRHPRRQGGAPIDGVESNPGEHDPMRTFDLKPLSVPSSVIGLGTMIFHPDTQERDHGLLDAFVDAGGTYVDTAEVYGAVEEHGYSEMVIGEWLAARPERRGRIILATKGLIPGYCAPLHPGGASIGPERIHAAIDGSLARLKTDCLDIWMFHRDDPSLDVGPLVDALDEEIRAGRTRAWGASNWTTARLQQAAEYADRAGRAGPAASSPHFSLAKAREPYWPDTVVTGDDDRAWFAKHGLPLVAWSSLGRGFFAHGREGDESDPDLVRVFHSPGNFRRKQRLGELAGARGMTIFEAALGWVISQPFPVVALCGPRTEAEVRNCARAGDLTLTGAERDWLDLRSDSRPF